jgi:hypothetical protein
MASEDVAPEPAAVGRRAFVRRVVGGAAVAAAAGTTAPADDTKPKLSPLGEARLRAILARHGERLSKEEKADLPRLLAAVEAAGEKLKSFPLEENSEPSPVFRVYRAGRA